jgi:hypothetical protein
MDREDTLPESNAAIEGGSNGALDGANMTDLKRGYAIDTIKDEADPYYYSEEPMGGFCGRPQGWER